MELARTGSHRARARNADRATLHLHEQHRKRTAAKTYMTLQEFEDNQRASQEDADDLDDLPAGADATRLKKMGHSKSGHSHSGHTLTHSQHVHMAGSQSVPHLAKYQESLNIDHDTCARRPPSPLAIHDYGCISGRPRSVFSQQQALAGRPARPKHRQTSCGFYFPGPQFRQGPYGFSLLEPIYLGTGKLNAIDHRSLNFDAQHLKEGTCPPIRFQGSRDVRPATTDLIDRQRNPALDPVTSDIVRPTLFHGHRARKVYQCLERQREESVMEHVCFENSCWEGRHREPGRDPVLDKTAPIPEDDAGEGYGWIALPAEELTTQVRRNASRILYGIVDALRETRGKLTHLFKPVTRATPGVLEPEDFLEGLIKIGIVNDGELLIDDIVEAMTIIDPKFDGRVNFPALGLAVAAAQRAQIAASQASERMQQQREVKLSQSYSESIPVEVVSVDRESRSRCIFERSFEKFKSQQRVLLSHHDEIPF